ncbi:MAG: hypothetical protein J6K21_03495 [Bacilli bacterium]|nr:hypothetical protein [Bacilli bacterium]
MKKLISFLFCLMLIGVIYYYRNDITKYVIDNYIYKKEINIPESNEYKRNYNFQFIQETNNFYPNNKQELYNIFYTILNNGYDSFTFYCGDNYTDCESDVKDLTRDNNQILSIINNYVHPYNSYSSISVNMNSLGRITVNITKLYNGNDIYTLNNFINNTYTKLIKNNMTDEQKIKIIHDYIINNSVYDKTWITTSSENRIHKSNIAYGPLIEKIGLCGGYTDAMELFLEKIGIKSYKIASDNHIWNYVYVDNKWKHLDLTWDDPVTNTGKNILQYDYYLIDTINLENKKDNEHNYPKEYYIEAK